MKLTKSKIIIGTGVIGVVIVATAVLLVYPSTAQPIPPESTFAQAQKLSRGDKESCLAETRTAAEAVARDDTTTEFGGTKISGIEMVASGAIIDIPAGTNFDITVSSYQSGSARGVLAYEKEYGTYNYTMQKQAKAGEWKLVSMTACKKP